MPSAKASSDPNVVASSEEPTKPVAMDPLPPPLGSDCLKVIVSSPTATDAPQGGRDPMAGSDPVLESSGCAKGDANDCTQRCDRGSARACKILADAFVLGKGVPRDGARAQLLFEQACGMGDLVACTSAAVAYEQGSHRHQDTGCAQALYEHACSQNELQGCWMLGGTYIKQHDTLEKGLELLQKACDGGVGYACIQLADHLVKTEGAQAAHRIKVLFKKACAAGIDKGCQRAKLP